MADNQDATVWKRCCEVWEQSWPCDAARLQERVAELERERDAEASLAEDWFQRHNTVADERDGLQQRVAELERTRDDMDTANRMLAKAIIRASKAEINQDRYRRLAAHLRDRLARAGDAVHQARWEKWAAEQIHARVRWAWTGDLMDALKERDRARDTAVRLESEVARRKEWIIHLESVLEYYADADKYRLCNLVGDWMTNEIAQDRGYRARKALAPTGEKGQQR